MGSKGSQTVNKTETYTPNPLTTQYATQALGGLGMADPYGKMTARNIAQFTPDQIAAIEAQRGVQGLTSPGFTAANQYLEQGSTPIDFGRVGDLYNKISGPQLESMYDLYRQQMGQTTRDLVGAAGGTNADRVGVGQANLAKQQALATGEATSRWYQQAMDQYNQEKMRQQSAAVLGGNLTMGQLAGRLQEIQGLTTSGEKQWALAQLMKDAPWAFQNEQAMWPVQQAMMMAQATGQLAPGLGGTKTGQTTYPAPSFLSQIAGPLTAGIGAVGKYGLPNFGNMFGGGEQNPYDVGGANSDWAYGENGQIIPNSAYEFGGAYGGRIPYADGGEAGYSNYPSGPDSFWDEMGRPPTIPSPSAGGKGSGTSGLGSGGGGGDGFMGGKSDLTDAINLGLKVLPFVLSQGGAVPAKPTAFDKLMEYAHGGEVEPPKKAEGGAWGNISDYDSTISLPDGTTVSYPKFNANKPETWGLGDGKLPAPGTPNPPPMPGAFDPEKDPDLGEQPGQTALGYAPTGASPTIAPTIRAPAEGELPRIPNYPAMAGPISRDSASDPWGALMRAGFGMMAASGKRDANGLPLSGLGVIGEGAKVGFADMDEQAKQAREDQRLQMQAQQHLFNAQKDLLPYTTQTATQKEQHRIVEDHYKRADQLARDIHERSYSELNAKDKAEIDRKIEQDKLKREEFEAKYNKLTMKEKMEELRPFKIKDEDGNELTAIRDLEGGGFKIIDPITGKPRNPTEIEEARERASYVGDQYLATLSPARQEMLKALRDGRMLPPTGSALRSESIERLMKQAFRAFPGWDASVGKARYETRADFSKGVASRNVTSTETVMSHMENLVRTSEMLAGSKLRSWNRVENVLRDQFGETALASYLSSRAAVSEEIAKMFQGAGVTTEDAKKRWLDVLDHARTPEQFKAVVKELLSLSEGRMNALANQWNRGMNQKTEADPEYKNSGKEFLSPENQEKFEKLKEWAKTPTPRMEKELASRLAKAKRAAEKDAADSEGKRPWLKDAQGNTNRSNENPDRPPAAMRYRELRESGKSSEEAAGIMKGEGY